MIRQWNISSHTKRIQTCNKLQFRRWISNAFIPSNEWFRKQFQLPDEFTVEKQGTLLHFTENDKLFDPLLSWLSQKHKLHSFEFLSADVRRTQLFQRDVRAGFGSHTVNFKDSELHVIHHPVSSESEFSAERVIILFAPQSKHLEYLLEFCNEVSKQSGASGDLHEGNVNVMHYHHTWKTKDILPARSLDSVVLDPKLKNDLVNDLKRHLSEDNRSWYLKHQIPFKRAYLLHGQPGTGKTSTIHAVCSEFGLNLCQIQPFRQKKNIDDEELAASLRNVPSNSVVVLEDVDSLFIKHEQEKAKAVNRSTITFSGLLNCLDGLGSRDGVVVMMTTNNKESLHRSLTRSGRVDKEVEFGLANQAQVSKMFLKFYPGEDDLAEKFAKKQEQKLSTADIQEHFIRHRSSTAEQACEKVSLTGKDKTDDIQKFVL